MPAAEPLRICTVALQAELAQARVLARSLGAVHPGSSTYVLLLDDRDGRRDGDGEPFEVLHPADIGLSREGFEHLAALCAPAGLRAIARAHLLRFLRRETGGPLVHLDPTVRVYEPLEAIGSALADHDLLINPTLSAPIPDDGLEPSAEDVASWSAYDSGVIGVGTDPAAAELLEWWSEQASREGSGPDADPFALSQLTWWIEEEARLRSEVTPEPRFAPDRLLDLAAGIARRPFLLTDPGYNAGYWNIHGREISARQIDGRPLRSFNFRGFDPARRSLLSRHQTRVSLADHPALAELCAGYAAELSEQGHEEAAATPYGFAALADGTRLDERLRRLYREWSQSGAPVAAPFDEAGQRAFYAWLSEPPGPRSSLGANRFLFAIYLERPDLQRAMPPGLADFGEQLGEWARTSGREEVDIPPQLLPAGDEAAAPAEATGPSETPAAPAPVRFENWGVNVVGFHRFDFGIAQAGRLAIEALDARGIPLLPIHDLSLGRYKAAGPPFATLGLEAADFPLNLLCMNGDHTVDLAARDGRGLFEGRYSIGLWFWETDRLPEHWMGAFELLDEVWAPSAYVAEVVGRSSPVPVNQVRLPVRVRPAAPLDRAAYGIGEDEFLFLYMFDFDSVGTRKNPLGTVEAFKRAFPPGSGASLLLKSSFSANAVGHFETLRQAAAEHPDVHLADGRVSSLERDSLLAGCDCYVSLHRSEGFGLTPAEAMLYARPVIATSYGGVTDFMSEENGYLVDYELIPVGPGLDPYPADARWADPDLEQAAGLMRHVFEDREEARERGLRAAEELNVSHSPEAAGLIMERRLAEIRTRFMAEAGEEPATQPSRRGRLAAKLRRQSPEQPAAAAAPNDLAVLSASLLAQARGQERRVEELEHARLRLRGESLPERAEP